MPCTLTIVVILLVVCVVRGKGVSAFIQYDDKYMVIPLPSDLIQILNKYMMASIVVQYLETI